MSEILSSLNPRKRLLPRRTTADDWEVLVIHHSAVPGYDIIAASAGMSQDAIQRELELDWHSSIGKRVFPNFGYAKHVSELPLQFNPKQPLYCGWDFGQVPAFIPTQVNAHGQWLIFPPVAPGEEASLSVYEFGEIVADHLQQFYCSPYNLTLKQLRMVHYGDPAGAAPPARVGDSPKEIRSCFDIIRKGVEITLGLDEDGEKRILRKPGWGWHIRPGAVSIKERLEAVDSRLRMSMRDGISAVVVDPRATTIIDGFLGQYHFKQYSDGTYDRNPAKNWTSHQMDALQYVATRLFSHVPEEEEDEDERPTHVEFVSHASGRNRY